MSVPKRKKRKKDKTLGFVIIELVVVLGIGALIIIGVFLTFSSAQAGQKNDKRTHDINVIKQAMIDYRNNGKLTGTGVPWFPWPGYGGGICLNLGVQQGGAACDDAADFFYNKVQPQLQFYDLTKNLFYATDYTNSSGSNGLPDPAAGKGPKEVTPNVVWMTSAKACGPDGSATPTPAGYTSHGTPTNTFNQEVQFEVIIYELEDGTLKCTTVLDN